MWGQGIRTADGMGGVVEGLGGAGFDSNSVDWGGRSVLGLIFRGVLALPERELGK